MMINILFRRRLSPPACGCLRVRSPSSVTNSLTAHSRRRGPPGPAKKEKRKNGATCMYTFLPRPGRWFVCNLRSRDYLPTYLPIYGKTLQNYFHIWVDPQVPTYLTYLPTYHPNLMAPIVRPPDVFLWSWTSSMPFLRFLSGFGKKNGRESGPRTAGPSD